MSVIIELDQVTKTFKVNTKNIPKKMKEFVGEKEQNKIIALNKVSIKISQGETVGIIGNNGSGKTTLLRIISKIYHPDSGTVKIKGKIAPLMQIGIGFNNELDAKENIIISGLLYGIPKGEINQKIEKILKFAELEKFYKMPLKQYSTGMRTRLAFATALQVNPDIFLIDEIFAVGDKNFREKSFDTFNSLKEKGKTILITTHNLGLIKNFCDRAILIDKGKIIKIGKPQEVLEEYRNLN